MGCVVVRNRDESAAGPCTSSADSPADLSSSTVHFALGSAMLSILSAPTGAFKITPSLPGRYCRYPLNVKQAGTVATTWYW